MKYFVRFKCPVIECLRPDGFPKQVYASFACSVDSFETLVGNIDKQLITMINNGGILCWPDETTNETVEKVFEKRLFVPMHMIANIQHEIKLLADPSGILTMKPTREDDLEDPNPPIGEQGLPS
jgi:hypothetical protein